MNALAKRNVYYIVGTCILAMLRCVVVVYLLSALFDRARDTSQNETTTELFAMDTYITMTAYGRDAETALTIHIGRLE